MLHEPTPEAAPPARPLWLVVITEAKRVAWASLPVEEQAAAMAAQRDRRERAKARADAKRELARRIYSLVFDGEKLELVAAAVGRTQQRVRDICATWGFPVAQRARCRRAPPFWVSDGAYAALVHAAADKGWTVPKLLEELIGLGAADDAHVIRRTLRIGRRATT